MVVPSPLVTVMRPQSIFDFPEEAQDHDMLDGSDWEYPTANTLHVTDDQFVRFHAKVKQKFDRHLNEYEGKFTVDQVGTNSVFLRNTNKITRITNEK